MSHEHELEKMIDALDIQPIDAALVEFCRVTARQMDASGGAPSTRLASIYMSLLRNLRKVGPKPAGLSAGGRTLAEFRDVSLGRAKHS